MLTAGETVHVGEAEGAEEEEIVPGVRTDGNRSVLHLTTRGLPPHLHPLSSGSGFLLFGRKGEGPFVFSLGLKFMLG